MIARERPVLFSALMVRAILAGTKTQTRRLVDPRGFAGTWLRELDPDDDDDDDVRGACAFVADPGNYPPYVADQRLWVRETWAHDADSLEALRAEVEDASSSATALGHGPYYRADGTHENAGLRWRPSIHMPRWASRITLEVTSVRVERLQSISEEDARAEGIAHTPCGFGPSKRESAVQAFAELWNEINGKRCLWSSNPFVWAISFRRMVTT